MVITHHADSTRALFDMTKRYHENCPEILRPHTKYSSRRELSFDVLSSSFVVATAGGDSVGRGETLTHLHASELAFWPKSTAADIWNGLLQAVPNAKGTAVFVESTANGVTGVFYDLWRGATAGRTASCQSSFRGSRTLTTGSLYQRTSSAHLTKRRLREVQPRRRAADVPAQEDRDRTASTCSSRNTQLNPKKPS